MELRFCNANSNGCCSRTPLQRFALQVKLDDRLVDWRICRWWILIFLSIDELYHCPRLDSENTLSMGTPCLVYSESTQNLLQIYLYINQRFIYNTASCGVWLMIDDSAPALMNRLHHWHRLLYTGTSFGHILGSRSQAALVVIGENVEPCPARTGS